MPEAASEFAAIQESEILDLLTSLVDKSMVFYDEATGRYQLLETVRQYARGKMLDDGEMQQGRDLHLAYFLALAEEAEPHLTGADQRQWLEQLATEHDNLRAALAWSVERKQGPEGSLRLCGAIWRFWSVRGHYRDGRTWCRLALALPADSGLLATRARALVGSGVLAHAQGDYAEARSLYEESLSILMQLDDRRGIAVCLNNLGNIAWSQSEYASASSSYADSLSVLRDLNDRSGIAASLGNLGNVAYEQGDYISARLLQEESLAIRRELGDQQSIANSLNNLGVVASEQSDYSSARSMHEESLSIRRELGDRRGIALSLVCLGSLDSTQRDYVSARSRLDESLTIRRDLGDPRGIAESLHCLGELAYEQGDHPAAISALKECLIIQRELGARRGIALALGSLGNVAFERALYVAARDLMHESLAIFGDLSDRRNVAESLEGNASVLAALGAAGPAARIWGAAERLREQIGSPLPPNGRSRKDRHTASARAALNDDASFALSWQEGRAMTLDQAVECALEENLE